MLASCLALPPPDPAARWGLPTRVFGGATRLAAMAAAVAWLDKRGFAVGSMERENPMGVKLGDVPIAKWSTIDSVEKRKLDGQITWGADGSAVIELLPWASNTAVAAFQREA